MAKRKYSLEEKDLIRELKKDIVICRYDFEYRYKILFYNIFNREFIVRTDDPELPEFRTPSMVKASKAYTSIDVEIKQPDYTIVMSTVKPKSEGFYLYQLRSKGSPPLPCKVFQSGSVEVSGSVTPILYVNIVGDDRDILLSGIPDQVKFSINKISYSISENSED